jgi:hypothetical protein
LRILRKVVRLIAVLQQFLDAKAARITMGILAGIVPAHSHTRSRGAADERNGLGDDINTFGVLPRDPDFCFSAELDVHDCFCVGSCCARSRCLFLRLDHQLCKRHSVYSTDIRLTVFARAGLSGKDADGFSSAS